jgi:hypothetical protein
MLAAAVSTHPMRAHATGECAERGPCADYLQDRALIKQNLGPTVGEYKNVFGHRRGLKKIRRGATVKAN